MMKKMNNNKEAHNKLHNEKNSSAAL